MKTPETSSENPSQAEPTAAVDPRKARSAEEPFVPLYLRVPPKPGVPGLLNLLLGAFALVCALVLTLVGSLFFGWAVVLPVLTCLLAFTLLWALARMRLFQQRNGLFLALSLLSLLGALVALGQHGYIALEQWLKTVPAMAEKSVEPAPESAPVPAAVPKSLVRPVVKPAPIAAAAPVPVKTAPATAKPALPVEAAPVAAAEAPAPPVPSDLPLLSEAFKLKTAEEPKGPYVKVLRDSPVLIGPKPYRVNAGEMFAFDSLKDQEVVFAANELRLRIARGAVELVNVPGVAAAAPPVAMAEGASPGPDAAAEIPAGAEPDETPAQATERAQKEAARRYPALALKDSAENQLYIETFRQLRDTESEMLKDPEWPLALADFLARKEGWERK